MKKKIISLLLAVVMCFGTLFAFAACEEKQKDQINSGVPVTPTDTEKTLYAQLATSMTEALSSVKAVEATFEVSYKSSRNGALPTDKDYFDMQMKGGAAASFRDLASFKADAYVFGKGTAFGEALPEGAYEVAYLRPDAVYTGEGGAIEYGNYEALKAAIKDGSVQLEQGALQIPEDTAAQINEILALYQELLQSAPAITEEEEAMFELFGGSIEETETGYVMTWSVPDMIDAIVVLLSDTAAWIGENEQVTVSEFLQDEQVHASLAAMLEGYAAKDLFSAIRALLDMVADEIAGQLPPAADPSLSDVDQQIDEIYQMICAILPEPQENETMLAYVERCIASEELFATLLELLQVEGCELKCLGDVNFAFVLQAMGTTASDLVKYAEMLQDWKTMLLSAILGGAVEESDIALTYSFLFDKAKKMTGVALDVQVRAEGADSVAPDIDLTLSAEIALKDHLELFDIG